VESGVVGSGVGRLEAGRPAGTDIPGAGSHGAILRALARFEATTSVAVGSGAAGGRSLSSGEFASHADQLVARESP
jgi:hypothetical protein